MNFSSELGKYLFLTFGICWLLAGIFYITGLEFGGMAGFALALIYMLG